MTALENMPAFSLRDYHRWGAVNLLGGLAFGAVVGFLMGALLMVHFMEREALRHGCAEMVPAGATKFEWRERP